MTGKCKSRIYCPQCIEEKGDYHVYKSMSHFMAHVGSKHYKVKKIKTIVRAGFCSNRGEEAEYEVRTIEDWWPEWEEKFKQVNSGR